MKKLEVYTDNQSTAEKIKNYINTEIVPAIEALQKECAKIRSCQIMDDVMLDAIATPTDEQEALENKLENNFIGWESFNSKPDLKEYIRFYGVWKICAKIAHDHYKPLIEKHVEQYAKGCNEHYETGRKEERARIRKLLE